MEEQHHYFHIASDKTLNSSGGEGLWSLSPRSGSELLVGSLDWLDETNPRDVGDGSEEEEEGAVIRAWTEESERCVSGCK